MTSAATAAATPWPRIFVLYFCGIGAGLQFAKASVVYDALRSHYEASPALAGWLVSSVGVCGVVLGASAGLVVARLGPRTALLGALVGGALIAFAESAPPPVSIFLALRLLEGAAHLAIVVAAPTCMLGLAAPNRRSVVLGIWATFMSIAFLIAGSAAPFLVGRFGLPAIFAAHGLVLTALAAAAFVAAPATPAPPTARGSLGEIFKAHIEIYANPRTATPAVCFLAYTGMYLALQTLTPQLAPPGQRDAIIVGMAFVSIVASLAAGVLAQRGLSPFRLTIGAFCATLAASFVVQAAVGAEGWIGPAAMFRMAFLSLLPGAILPMIPRLNVDGAAQARAFGAIAQTGNVGSALGPPLFAASAAAIGPWGLLAPTAALCLFGVAAAARAATFSATTRR